MPLVPTLDLKWHRMPPGLRARHESNLRSMPGIQPDQGVLRSMVSRTLELWLGVVRIRASVGH